MANPTGSWKSERSKMIAVKEAVQRVLQETEVLGNEELPVVEARGHVLAEEVRADVDMPPFHKSSMDGYALKASDSVRVPAVLEVVGTIAAGTSPTLKVQTGQAAKIMTGAPLPAGADAVQKVELTTSGPDGRVTILEPVVRGTNVARRGEIFAAGTVVVSRGTLITPATVGLLAAVGRESVQVHKRPKVAILVTGDELVPPGKKPGPGQIRNSNGYALQAQVLGCGAIPEMLGIASDVKKELAKKIAAGLNADVLLISGGVSMGEFDLVEDVLAEHAVTIFFEKVSIKPGKPTVFGRREKTLVFGLPGNPVSASTVFEVLVKPVLRKMSGFKQWHNPIVRARLANAYKTRTSRENYHPAVTELVGSRFRTRPLASKGSADILAFARSNSYLITTSDKKEFSPGDEVRVMLRDEFWQTQASE